VRVESAARRKSYKAVGVCVCEQELGSLGWGEAFDCEVLWGYIEEENRMQNAK